MQYLGSERGAMSGDRQVKLHEVNAFVERWLRANGSVVQDWVVWEAEAARALCYPHDVWASRSEVMHGVMAIAVAIVTGTLGDVKRALRDAAPSSLELAKRLLGHLPQFAAVVEAELQFRLGRLDGDWSLEADGSGRCVVRSQYRDRGTSDH